MPVCRLPAVDYLPAWRGRHWRRPPRHGFFYIVNGCIYESLVGASRT